MPKIYTMFMQDLKPPAPKKKKKPFKKGIALVKRSRNYGRMGNVYPEDSPRLEEKYIVAEDFDDVMKFITENKKLSKYLITSIESNWEKVLVQYKASQKNLKGFMFSKQDQNTGINNEFVVIAESWSEAATILKLTDKLFDWEYASFFEIEFFSEKLISGYEISK